MNPPSIEARVQRLVRDGDSHVLDLLYDNFAQILLALLVAHLRNKTDAEDVLHQIFLDLARHPEQLLRPRKLAPWLCTKARNRAIDMQRQSIRREQRHTDWSDALRRTRTSEQTTDNSILYAALDSIPAKQREVVAMKAFQNLSFTQIAEALHISQNTAASRYRYALQKMRRKLTSA